MKLIAVISHDNCSVSFVTLFPPIRPWNPYKTGALSTISTFYGVEELEDQPLSAVRECLFNMFLATVPIRRPFLHPQPCDAPCRGDRVPCNVATSTLLTADVIILCTKNLYLIHDSHFAFHRKMCILPQVRCHCPPI
jgi:hypothetical protein